MASLPIRGSRRAPPPALWHEDRDSGGKRYGDRTGSHSECIADNHYEDSAGSFDCADGTVYKGHDSPGGPAGLLAGVWDFELMVVDACNDDKQVGASDTLKINR